LVFMPDPFELDVCYIIMAFCSILREFLDFRIFYFLFFFFFKQKTAYEIGLGIPAEPLFRSQKAASGGIQGDVLATDNNTVGMGDAGIKSAIQGSNVPNPDEAVPSFVSGAMAKAGKGLLEGTLQAGTSAVSDKLLDLV